MQTDDDDKLRTSRLRLALSRTNISAEAEGSHAVDRVIILAVAIVLIVGAFWSLTR